MGNNAWNEVITIQRSQEMLKIENAVPLYVDIFLQLIVSLKNRGTTTLLALMHTRHQLSLDGAGFRGLEMDSVDFSSDYFVSMCIPASETTLHRK
jgi:hypothetical protein